MENLSNPLYDIKIRDIQVLLDLIKTKSVRELARQLDTTPSQISKIVKGLEERLGVKLLNRSQQGVEPTPEASEVLKSFAKIQSVHEKLYGELKAEKKEDLLSFASTSFVTTHLLPPVLSKFKEGSPQTRFRTIDLPPSQFVPVGLRDGFQLCLHMGTIDWPKTWTSVEVGNIRWDLYCRGDHPLSKKPKLDKIIEYPFIYPVYWSNEGIRFGDDGCPLSIRKRIRGHETATATTAVEMMRHSDQLAFLPHLVTEPWLSLGEIRKLPVPTWRPVKRKLFLTVKNDYIKQSVFKEFKELLRDSLAL